MSMDRRSVLKSLAAAGLAISGVPLAARAADRATAAPLAAAAAGALPVTPLVSGSALDTAFVAGVQQAAGTTGTAARALQGLDASTYTKLDALLHDDTPTLLVGLLDDAAATLVIDLVRSAGGRVLAVEHHRAGQDAAAHQWASTLGQALAAGAATPVAAAQGTAYVSLRCVI